MIMRGDAESGRTGTRRLLLQLAAVFALAAGLALATTFWGAASAPPVSSARADVRPVAQRAPDAPPAVEARRPAESAAIREAHSDGGYWYWLEQQPAGRR
jgi:hypothetical protein